jgi:hypothetical protein
LLDFERGGLTAKDLGGVFPIQSGADSGLVEVRVELPGVDESEACQLVLNGISDMQKLISSSLGHMDSSDGFWAVVQELEDAWHFFEQVEQLAAAQNQSLFDTFVLLRANVG